jgi:hypothetical protein
MYLSDLPEPTVSMPVDRYHGQWNVADPKYFIRNLILPQSCEEFNEQYACDFSKPLSKPLCMDDADCVEEVNDDEVEDCNPSFGISSGTGVGNSGGSGGTSTSGGFSTSTTGPQGTIYNSPISSGISYSPHQPLIPTKKTNIQYRISKKNGDVLQLSENAMMSPKEMIGICKFVALTAHAHLLPDTVWSVLIDNLGIANHFDVLISSAQDSETHYIYLYDPL